MTRQQISGVLPVPCLSFSRLTSKTWTVNSVVVPQTPVTSTSSQVILAIQFLGNIRTELMPNVSVITTRWELSYENSVISWQRRTPLSSPEMIRKHIFKTSARKPRCSDKPIDCHLSQARSWIRYNSRKNWQTSLKKWSKSSKICYNLIHICDILLMNACRIHYSMASRTLSKKSKHRIESSSKWTKMTLTIIRMHAAISFLNMTTCKWFDKKHQK